MIGIDRAGRCEPLSVRRSDVKFTMTNPDNSETSSRKNDQSSAGRPTAWRTLKSHDVLTVPGRFAITVETVELPDGRIIDDYWQIRASSYVVVFAETEDDRVICLRQYRHGARREGLELIAGHVDAGESPDDAARRELLEETGFASSEWQSMGAYVISATQGSGTVHFFRARRAVRQTDPASGDLEMPIVVLLSRKQLISELHQGHFTTADHIAGVAAALLPESESYF